MSPYGDDKLKIFSGNSNKNLASEICSYIGVEPGAIEVGRFSNGEIRVIIDENVRGSDVFVVQPTSDPVNDNLMELLIIIDALRRASASRITAVVPFYGYARQDRKTRGREPITAKLVANLLESAGADRVLAMDLHAGQIQGFFDIPVDHLTAIPLLSDYFKEQAIDDVVVVSPDAGGIARARDMAARLGAPVAFIDKRRPEPNVAEVMHIVGQVSGKNVILLDDMIDTGGSIVEAARALRQEGASSVRACATHPVFSGKAPANIPEAKLDQLVVTNTIPIAESMKSVVEVISVAPLFGDAIVRIHEGRSVSAMFR
ncbi:MAG: ribose-phosphate diphosphokinase [Bacillota bacterium]|nr:ribose-phosphate pyrophosphokinase [Candidatus Fermentithermobacillaceae bacterium]